MNYVPATQPPACMPFSLHFNFSDNVGVTLSNLHSLAAAIQAAFCSKGNIT